MFKQIKDNKDEMLPIRLTKNQKEKIKERAAQKNMYVSEYILNLVENDLLPEDIF